MSDNTINRQIAEALGYVPYTAIEGHTFDGKDIERELWIKPDGGRVRKLTDWAGNANAAWELLPITRHIRISRLTDRGGAAAGIPNEICTEIWNCAAEPSVVEAIGFGGTLALSMCHAFLKWHQREAQQHGA